MGNAWLKEHPEKLKISQKKYYHSHKEEYAIRQKKYRLVHSREIAEKKLKRAFGIDFEDYAYMFEAQRGCCAICGRHQDEFKKALHVDHNHVTGQIRGLLCFPCNRGLGRFGDTKPLLLKAIKYLEKVGE